MNQWQELLNGNTSWHNNWSLGGCEFYGEIMDDKTFGVWLSTQPITPEEYAALEIPEGFRKSGVGRSQHDAAFFSKSPHADSDGPVDTIQIGTRTFACVARPGSPEPGFHGVTILPVFKTHRVLFEAGRTLELIDTNDGDARGSTLLPQAVDTHLHRRRENPIPREMPDGWTTRSITLAETLIVNIPCPARVAIFKNGDIYHGPVSGL